MNSEVTKTDITKEAKEILSVAMRNFCTTPRVKSEKESWIENRTMQIRIHDGLDEKEAKEQATREYDNL